QAAVFALGLDTAVVQQVYPVTRTDRGDAVRQENRRAAGEEARQRVVQERLGVVVHRLLRLLDDDDGRVAQDGPCQGDQELLAAAQRVAQLADGRLVALG